MHNRAAHIDTWICRVRQLPAGEAPDVDVNTIAGSLPRRAFLGKCVQFPSALHCPPSPLSSPSLFLGGTDFHVKNPTTPGAARATKWEDFMRERERRRSTRHCTADCTPVYQRLHSRETLVCIRKTATRHKRGLHSLRDFKLTTCHKIPAMFHGNGRSFPNDAAERRPCSRARGVRLCQRMSS